MLINRGNKAKEGREVAHCDASVKLRLNTSSPRSSIYLVTHVQYRLSRHFFSVSFLFFFLKKKTRSAFIHLSCHNVYGKSEVCAAQEARQGPETFFTSVHLYKRERLGFNCFKCAMSRKKKRRKMCFKEEVVRDKHIRMSLVLFKVDISITEQRRYKYNERI